MNVSGNGPKTVNFNHLHNAMLVNAEAKQQREALLQKMAQDRLNSQKPQGNAKPTVSNNPTQTVTTQKVQQTAGNLNVKKPVPQRSEEENIKILNEAAGNLIKTENLLIKRAANLLKENESLHESLLKRTKGLQSQVVELLKNPVTEDVEVFTIDLGNLAKDVWSFVTKK